MPMFSSPVGFKAAIIFKKKSMSTVINQDVLYVGVTNRMGWDWSYIAEVSPVAIKKQVGCDIF